MNKKSLLLFSHATVAIAFVIAACSSSTDPKPEDYTGSCSVLASRCHPVQTTLGKACHDLGHDGDDAKCGPKKAECLAECPEREGGTAHSDSGTDSGPATDSASEAAADSGPDLLCLTYCTCLTDACSTQAGYPFAAAGSCATACATMNADQRKCWPNFCEQAKASSGSKEHLCEHAWGALGLDECP